MRFPSSRQHPGSCPYRRSHGTHGVRTSAPAMPSQGPTQATRRRLARSPGVEPRPEWDRSSLKASWDGRQRYCRDRRDRTEQKIRVLQTPPQFFGELVHAVERWTLLFDAIFEHPRRLLRTSVSDDFSVPRVPARWNASIRPRSPWRQTAILAVPSRTVLVTALLLFDALAPPLPTQEALAEIKWTSPARVSEPNWVLARPPPQRRALMVIAVIVDLQERSELRAPTPRPDVVEFGAPDELIPSPLPAERLIDPGRVLQRLAEGRVPVRAEVRAS
jgi:hypothetical protein